MFVVVFAILQKSKVLGEGKAQADAMVGMVIGLILIGVPASRDLMVSIISWMPVALAVLLVFLILYGFIAGDLSSIPDPLKYTLGTLAGLFTVGVVLSVSGVGSGIWDSFGGNSDIWMNVLMIALVLGVVAVAVFGNKNKSP